MSDNVYKLGDGSSIIKGANGKIRKHIPSKDAPSGKVIAFKNKTINDFNTLEPRMTYDNAYLKYKDFVKSKKATSLKDDEFIIIEDTDNGDWKGSPYFVNHELVARDHRQAIEYKRDTSGIVRDNEGEPLGILLRYESPSYTDGETTVEYGDNHLLHVAYLELEPWVSPIDRGRGIEYRLIMQELENPLVVNPTGVDFLGTRVSVAEDNTALAVELLQENWTIDSSIETRGFNVFEKIIPLI